MPGSGTSITGGLSTRASFGDGNGNGNGNG